jgi:hypothetical protein
MNVLNLLMGITCPLAGLLTWLIGPAMCFAHQDTHQFEQFTDNVADLLGEHPAHDILAGLCDEVEGSGKGVWLNGISAEDSDDATQAVLTDKNTRVEFHQKDAGDQTFANYLLTKTPHMDVSKILTYSAPWLNEWGHYFDEDEGWQHLTDPKGTEVNVGVRKIFKGRDSRFLIGAAAATVSRKTDDNDTLHSVSLPANQTLDDMVYADVDVDSLPSMICEKFDNVWYAKGSPIYCAISATLARHFRKNSRNQIHNNDFVRSYEHFAKGTVPEIDGVTFIVLPQSMMNVLVDGDAIDTYLAWVPNAINKVSYSPFKTSEGVSPDHRFDTAVYLREKIDFKRIDDQGVVMGDILDVG